MERNSLFPTNTSAQCGVPLTWCFSKSTAAIQKASYVCSRIIRSGRHLRESVSLLREALFVSTRKWARGAPERERCTHLQESVLVPLFASHTPPPFLFSPWISPSCHLAGSGSMWCWKAMLHINTQSYESELDLELCLPLLTYCSDPHWQIESHLTQGHPTMINLCYMVY